MNQTAPSQTAFTACIRQHPWRTLTLLALAASVVMPIWAVPYPPLLDYPNHLASSFVLGHLHDPRFTFGSYYTSNWHAMPYIATDFVMDVLSRILPALIAGKIVLSLGALGTPLAAWFFLRQADPGGDSIALWFLLAAHNIFFRYGFIGFYWGIALVFLTLGFWLRDLKRPSTGRWLATLAALMATYFTHLMGVFFFGLIAGIYSVTRPRVREWLRTAALFVPAAACYFVTSRVVEQQSDGGSYRTWCDKLDTFRLILHGNSWRIDEISMAAVVALFVFGWIRNKEFQWQWRWVLVSFGLLITFIALPESYGDVWGIDFRALPVFFISLFVMARFGRRGWMLAPLALLVFAARTYDMTKFFFQAQPELAGLAATFQLTPPSVKVLPIVENPDQTPVDPILRDFAHFWAYGVIERGWFAPYLFEIPGLLPLDMTADIYAPDDFWDMEYTSKIDWAQIQGDYDYIWAYNVPELDGSVRTIADAVYSSGKLKFYRVRKVPQPQPAPASPPGRNSSRRRIPASRPPQIVLAAVDR
jgi:hypothetical protein